MKKSRRYWLVTLAFGVIAVTASVALVWKRGAETEADRRAALDEGIRQIDSMCDHWAMDNSQAGHKYAPWDHVRSYAPAPPARSFLEPIGQEKTREFFQDGKDPFGNAYILSKMEEGPAIHPRTLFHLAATPEGRVLFTALDSYHPFSRSALFAQYPPDQIDLVRTIERAALFGQPNELKRAIADALSDGHDYAATTGGRGIGYSFQWRSASDRHALLKPAELLREVDSILEVLEASKRKSEPAFAITIFNKHIENYRAVREELKQLQKALEAKSARSDLE